MPPSMNRSIGIWSMIDCFLVWLHMICGFNKMAPPATWKPHLRVASFRERKYRLALKFLCFDAATPFEWCYVKSLITLCRWASEDWTKVQFVQVLKAIDHPRLCPLADWAINRLRDDHKTLKKLYFPTGFISRKFRAINSRRRCCRLHCIQKRSQFRAANTRCPCTIFSFKN